MKWGLFFLLSVGSVKEGGSAYQKSYHVVLDNAGYEVFTDLCLVYWLLKSGHAAEVVLHGKLMPWFVSDVTRDDFVWTLEQMKTSGEHPFSPPRPNEQYCSQLCCTVLLDSSDIRTIGEGLAELISSGNLSYEAHPFWTMPFDFSEMQVSMNINLHLLLCRMQDSYSLSLAHCKTRPMHPTSTQDLPQRRWCSSRGI